jgi:alkanesulfonate monooxygenase SsuD/methylene tetrahydromethanopterin reductase-like flavin-dependent oxidoreductase (luciferase family)
MWIGGASVPSDSVLRRIGKHADGWFALCSPEQLPELRRKIDDYARSAGRKPEEIGTESGLAVASRSEKEWLGILQTREKSGIKHLCMRTLGGDLDAAGHLAELARIYRVLVGQGHIDG